MKKFLLLFLSLSVCNSYASTAGNEPAPTEHTPLLGNSSISTLILQNNPSINNTNEPQRVTQNKPNNVAMELNSSDLAGNTGAGSFEKQIKSMNQAEFDNWVKGNWHNAIQTASDYAEKHPNEWNQVVDNLTECSKCRPSKADIARERFFSSVNTLVAYKKLDGERISRLENALQRESERNADLQKNIKDLEKELAELKEQMIKPVGQSELTLAALSGAAPETQNAGSSDRDLNKITDLLFELKNQMVALKSTVEGTGTVQGLTDNLELSRTVQSLSEKIDKIDLAGIMNQLEELKNNKVGVVFINKFTVLLQALVYAQKKESTEQRFITTEEWKGFVKDAEQKLKIK